MLVHQFVKLLQPLTMPHDILWDRLAVTEDPDEIRFSIDPHDLLQVIHCLRLDLILGQIDGTRIGAATHH